MCFAESGPGGKHIDFATYTRMVDRYVHLEGIADVLQLSGGEPTLHPDWLRMVRYAYEQPIQAVMINTNGIRLAHDPALVEALATMRDRLEIYLQFDGLEEQHLYDPARRGTAGDQAGGAGDAWRRHDIRCTLVCTVDHNTNLHEVGAVRAASGWSGPSCAASASSSPPTAAGTSIRSTWRSAPPCPTWSRRWWPRRAALVAESDFYPLPCAHPNCHLMCYLYRGGAGRCRSIASSTFASTWT